MVKKMISFVKKLNKILDLSNILGGVIMFFVIIVISIFVVKIPLFTSKQQPQQTPAQQINVSTLTKETIEHSKQNANDLNYDTTLTLLDSPIQTPPFVTDPDRLRDYLGKVAKTIVISGEIEDAYLFVQTGGINIQNESVYFYIVDGRTADGHLYPQEALQPVTDNIFIYNLKNLPLEQLPYSLNNPNHLIHKNIVDEIFNYQPKGWDRKYYIGAFVSTTKLPNQITSLEIRYKCKESTTCTITLQ